MIKDEELLNLPDDPESAFIEYERIVRERATEAINDAIENDDDADPFRLDYISHILAAVDMFGLDILKNWSVPSAAESGIEAIYHNFISDVNYATIQFRFKHARRTKRYSVELNAKTKSLIRHHLEQIKQIVDRLEVSEKKKSRLYSKIGDLENEVDRDRTRFDALMALILEGSSTTGEAAEKLEPLTKRIREITHIVGIAKAEEDDRTPQLSAPEERRRIEPPKGKLAPPKS